MKISRPTLVAVAAVISVIAFWLFWPCTHGGFLAGDDTDYLQQSIRCGGLTWNAVKWAFTSTYAYYQPLVRLSHALDYQVWGKSAAGHHATGVFLHALNAALVFGFLWTLLGRTALTSGERLALALWVALVFAIHPLQAESVGWLSGRTQQLCTMFGIGCLWAYVAGARRWAVWGLYVAALLCKPMAVSFPFVMLALDYYPLRRHEQLGWVRLVWEKTVWIALAGVVGVVTVITKLQQIGVPTRTVRAAKATWSLRVSLMSEALTYFPLKLAWPTHLSPAYPVPLDLSLKQWPVLASLLAVALITAAAATQWRRRPMLVAAWGAYAAFILPVSGLLVTTAQWVEQRHAYVAMVPLLLVAGAAGAWLWRRLPSPAQLLMVALIVGQLCTFAVRARGVIPDWYNDETRQRAIAAALPDSQEFNEALVVMLLDSGKPREAVLYARRGVEIAPQLWESHTTLAHALAQLGRMQEAVDQCEEALRLKPNNATAQHEFGITLMLQGRLQEAMSHYEQALQIDPEFFEVHNDLGLALARAGRVEEAICHYQQALWINPWFAAAHNNLGLALMRTGGEEEAIGHYEQALQIDPEFAAAHNNLGIALTRVGRLQEAIGHWEEALRIKPDFAEAHYSLGLALEKSGHTQDAILHYQQALQLKPDLVQARNALEQLSAIQ
ncbi:MAG: tetratricopeptide repeat protein [Verrucomicrobiia bacterium]